MRIPAGILRLEGCWVVAGLLGCWVVGRQDTHRLVRITLFDAADELMAHAHHDNLNLASQEANCKQLKRISASHYATFRSIVFYYNFLLFICVLLDVKWINTILLSH